MKAPFAASPINSGRHLGVLTFVISAHVLAVVLLLLAGRSNTRTIEPPVVLLSLDLESPAEQPRIEETRPRSIQGRHPEGVKAARANPVQEAAPSTESGRSGEAGGNAIINPEEPPRIDWRRESDAAVEDVLPNMIEKYTRLCAEADRPHTKHPAGCPRSFNEGYWKPSGNLLRDIRDPDRPRSSVPDLLPAFPKAPPSEVRIRPDP